MNEKKKPAEIAWADDDGCMLWALAPRNVPPTRSAAYVRTSEDGIYLTVAQCRAVAAHLTALADYHEEATSRTTPALPTKKGAIIVPADGHKRIEAVCQGYAYYAHAAALIGDHWRTVWRTAAGVVSLVPMAPEEITPGTWKEDDR